MTDLPESSVAGLCGDAEMSLYAGSKHAVVGLRKCAAGEYAAQKIRVNAIAPDAVATPMAGSGVLDLGPGSRIANQHPLGRVGTPQAKLHLRGSFSYQGLPGQFSIAIKG